MLSSASPWWGLAKQWESLDLGTSARVVCDTMWVVGEKNLGKPLDQTLEKEG